MQERGQTAALLYEAGVAKRSADLARSVRSTVGRGGERGNYLEATVVAGAVGPAADYVLPHEFGAHERYRENHGDPRFDETEGAHDLEQVLEMLAWVPM
jgi:hypothetical protein